MSIRFFYYLSFTDIFGLQEGSLVDCFFIQFPSYLAVYRAPPGARYQTTICSTLVLVVKGYVVV